MPGHGQYVTFVNTVEPYSGVGGKSRHAINGTTWVPHGFKLSGLTNSHRSCLVFLHSQSVNLIKCDQLNELETVNLENVYVYDV